LDKRMRKSIHRPRPLADFVDVCLGPALAAQGFAASDVIVAWPDIVGERLASFSQPVKIEWKRRSATADPEARPEPATLVVRVEGAFALEMQHLAPLVVERVNAHYGWRCVGRIVLKQGPVRRSEPKRAAPRTVSAADRHRVEAAVEPIEEAALKAALERLGEAVMGASAARPRTKA
jgi:hypothetical protein